MLDLSTLTRADFQPFLNQAFTIHITSHDPIQLELSMIEDMGPQTSAEAQADDRRRPFSLLFLGPPSDQYLLQAVYVLVHEQLGELALFLVPLGVTAEKRMRYEAVFT